MTQIDEKLPFIPVAKIFVDEALDCAKKANIDIEAMLIKLDIDRDNLGSVDKQDSQIS
jgi:hypothetical protein